jgi:hypothetical protein
MNKVLIVAAADLIHDSEEGTHDRGIFVAK